MTMTLVSTVTVGAGGAASIEFTGIPATATDLLVVISARDTSNLTVNQLYWTYNNLSNSAYAWKRLRGDGSTATSDGTTSATWRTSIPGNLATSSTFGNIEIYMPNYAGSTAKTASVSAVTENNGTAATQEIRALGQTDTSAITSIKFESPGQTIVQYSTASLYTILKGSGGATVA